MSNEIMNQISKQINNRPELILQDFPFITEEEIDLFQQNSDEIHILDSNRQNPLNIVIMGEVKSGKSTLINALVGKNIAPIGVTETTAVIMEISYGEKVSSVIKKMDGSVEEYSIDTLYQLLEDNKANSEFNQEIDRVQITYPLSELKNLHIIDTPGLETVTLDNQNTTVNFIQQADVILWVLNVHHLGQSDVDKKFYDVVDYGKPVIMLVNRVDQVDESDIDDVLEFVDDNYGLFVQKIFPVSGKLAFDAKENQDDAMLEQSGLPTIMNYLEVNINKNSSDVKETAMLSSYKQLANKEIQTCQSIIESIDFINHSIAERKKDIDYYRNKIKSEMHLDIQFWIENVFLRREEEAVRNKIASASKKVLKNESKEVNAMIQEYVSERYVNGLIQEKAKELQESLSKSLQHSLELIGDKFKLEAENYNENYNVQLSAIYDGQVLNQFSSDTTTDLVDGGKKGMIVGGAYGVAAAAYAAVLGPYAAGITIGTAIGAMVPPVLIVGAVTGAAVKLVNNDKRNKEMLEASNKSFLEIRKSLSIYMKEFMAQLDNRVDAVFDETAIRLNEIITQSVSVEQINQLKRVLNQYVEGLDASYSNQVLNLKYDEQY